MKTNEDAVILVTDAQQVANYTLLLRFSDGVERSIDFAPFLESSSNPLIREYLKPELFKSFQVRDGDLVWGDWELCFPVADLYEGTI